MRAKYRKFFTAPAQGRRGRSAGVWFIAATALISCAVSWWPQPVTATVHQGPATRLALGPAVQRHLLRLYAAYRHIPARSVAAAAPGQVFGARVQGSGRDWAMVHWQPSARAGQGAVVGFEDGAGTGIFTRSPGGCVGGGRAGRATCWVCGKPAPGGAPFVASAQLPGTGAPACAAGAGPGGGRYYRGVGNGGTGTGRGGRQAAGHEL